MRLAWGSVFRSLMDDVVTVARAELAQLSEDERTLRVANAEKFLEAWHQKVAQDKFPGASDWPMIDAALAIAGVSEDEQ